MTWIIIVIIIVLFTIIKFGTALNKDNDDLQGGSASDKFRTIVSVLNDQVFSGNGTITTTDKRSFNLYDGYNQIILFHYSTGHLTIIWKYKYYEKEIIHERTFNDVRNLSIFEQQKIANSLCNEMNVIKENHMNNVLSPIVQDIESTVNSNAKDFFKQGNEKKNNGDFQGAITDFTYAIKIDPKNEMAYFGRGNAYCELCMYEEAISDYSEMIKINPNNGDTYYHRGFAKKCIQDLSGAISDYDKCLELAPFTFQAYYSRGDVKRQMEDHTGAIDDFSKIIDNYGMHLLAYSGKSLPPNARYLEAYFGRSLSKIGLNLFQDAKIDVDKALEINADFTEAYYVRGMIHLALGDKVNAKNDLLKAGEQGIKLANDIDIYIKNENSDKYV